MHGFLGHCYRRLNVDFDACALRKGRDDRALDHRVAINLGLYLSPSGVSGAIMQYGNVPAQEFDFIRLKRGDCIKSTDNEANGVAGGPLPSLFRRRAVR